MGKEHKGNMEEPLYIGHRKRLKARYIKGGINALSEYEILELLLTYARPRIDVKPLSKSLLYKFKSIQYLLDTPIEELIEIKGIGEHTAILLKLVKDLINYYLKQEMQKGPVLGDLTSVLNYCFSSMQNLKDEELRAFFLNAKNRLIKEETLQKGTVNQSMVFPRKIFELALRYGATALILVHNHPSGDPHPSRADIEITNQIKELSNALNIRLHDHIIIGHSAHFSFHKEGLL